MFLISCHTMSFIIFKSFAYFCHLLLCFMFAYALEVDTGKNCMYPKVLSLYEIVISICKNMQRPYRGPGAHSGRIVALGPVVSQSGPVVSQAPGCRIAASLPHAPLSSARAPAPSANACSPRAPAAHPAWYRGRPAGNVAGPSWSCRSARLPYHGRVRAPCLPPPPPPARLAARIAAPCPGLAVLYCNTAQPFLLRPVTIQYVCIAIQVSSPALQAPFSRNTMNCIVIHFCLSTNSTSLLYNICIATPFSSQPSILQYNFFLQPIPSLQYNIVYCNNFFFHNVIGQ